MKLRNVLLHHAHAFARSAFAAAEEQRRRQRAATALPVSNLLRVRTAPSLREAFLRTGVA
jgi:hypothetical protein